MNIIILLILINFNLVFLSSTQKDSKDDKEYERTKRRVKALACTILSNRGSAFFQNTKRQIKELLFKNNIIKKAAEAKDKIPEFYAAICYTKIGVHMANNIIDNISKKNLDILQENYTELFEIDPNLNYTKIKRTMNRVNKIMKRIIAEEEKITKEKKANGTYVEEDFFGNNNTKNFFNITNIIYKVKKFYNDMGFKAFFGICLNTIVIIIAIITLCNKNNDKDKMDEDNKNENNQKEKKDEKKDDNKDKTKEKIDNKNNKIKKD